MEIERLDPSREIALEGSSVAESWFEISLALGRQVE
jgi:hypothetical protein